MASITSQLRPADHPYTSLNASPGKSDSFENEKSPLTSPMRKERRPIVRSQSYRYDPQLGTLVPEEPNCCTRHIGKCICVVFVLAAMFGLMRLLVGFAFNNDPQNPCPLTIATADVNLTQEGSLDWIHHGLNQNKYAINRKRTGYYLNLTWDQTWIPSYGTKQVYWSDGTVSLQGGPSRDAALSHAEFGTGLHILCPRCQNTQQYLLNLHFGCIFDCAIQLPTTEKCLVKSSAVNYVYSYNFTGAELKYIDPISLVAIDSYWGAADITFQAVTLSLIQ